MYSVHNSSTEHPDRKDDPTSLNAQDLVVGAVRLRPIAKVHESIAGCGISRRAMFAWLRALNVPVLYIGQTPYINLRYFEIALHSITRPGAPDFMVPGAQQVRKLDTHPSPYTREIDLKHFEDNIQVFIAELILARREKGIGKHENFKKSTDAIVEAITRQYDLMDAPLAYHQRTKRAVKNANQILYATEDPTQEGNFRVPSPTEQISPFIPPGEKEDDLDR